MRSPGAEPLAPDRRRGRSPFAGAGWRCCRGWAGGVDDGAMNGAGDGAGGDRAGGEGGAAGGVLLRAFSAGAGELAMSR